MKLAALLFLLTFSLMGQAQPYKLTGIWYNPENAGMPIRFIKVAGFNHFTGKETFVFPDGELSHTIEQTIKIKVSDSREFTGTVDVFDSRGCSYKGLAVTGEFESSKEVALLLTYPRYKFRTITIRSSDDRTVYCRNWYGDEYPCGRQRQRPSVRTECKLLEYVETPVVLHRSIK